MPFFVAHRQFLSLLAVVFHTRLCLFYSILDKNRKPILIESGSMTAREMLSDYCRILYDRLVTYEAVAKTTQLDRRTVKKHIGKEW
jgi:hypothetical protein